LKSILSNIFLLLLPFFSFGNLEVETYYVANENGYEILVHNEEFCPVTIEIKFDLKNLESSLKEDFIVVPASTKAFRICDLSIKNKQKAFSFTYTVNLNYGNHLEERYDKDFEYYLPFAKGESIVIGQGYNGTFSHKGENSLDFELDEGSAVHAARGGVVCAVVENNTKHCTNSECSQYNNFILVYHDDGTFAEYSHLQKNGALVAKGDSISIGQKIGISGNTGWSSGPHLHFMVFKAKMKTRDTVKTYFLINDGSRKEMLVEHKKYKRNY